MDELGEPFERDIAVPVVDGVPLHERVGDRFAGIDTSLVARPSRHLLGEPEYIEEDRTVLLDGDCGFAECCGVRAQVIVGDRTVRWTEFFARGHPPIPVDLFFEFDRQQYEAALASLDTVAVEALP